MKAIDFVVRDGAGGLQRGVVSSESNSHVIQAQSGQEISLNLQQADLQGHVRSGNDLLITLNDGRLITIDNYFNTGGDANRLFISSDGYLNEVSFVDQGAGDLYAQFGPTEQWGKWSPSDDLMYLGRTEVVSSGGDDEVSMFGAPLLGGGLLSGGAGLAAAVIGGGAIIGGLGGGGGNSGPAAPYVNEPDASTTIGGDDNEVDSIAVTGGGEPGDKVVVTIDDKVVETVVDDDGNFEAVFEGEDFPEDGEHEAVVVVTTGDGDVELDGPAYIIDTTPPAITVVTGTESVDDFFNAVGFEDGVTLTGTGEPGASMVVTIEGIEQSTTVAEDGTWSVSWGDGSLEAGEYKTDVKLVSTDAYGNSTTVNDVVVIDTIATVSIDTDTVETDGVVNGLEHADGVTLTGTAQAGSTVEVTFGTGTRDVTADADGNWTADFTAAEVPTGELMAGVTAVATDSYGNTATVTGEVQIDTVAPLIEVTTGTDSVGDFFNAVSFEGGVTLTGKGEAGASLDVTIEGITQSTTVGEDGTWTVSWEAGSLEAGEYNTDVKLVSTDAYGNATTVNDVVVIDTISTVTIDADAVAGDGVVNGAEHADGVTLTGTTQPGSSVVVTFGTGTRDATVDADGNWSAKFPAGEVPTGELMAGVTAVATDSYGNTSSATSEIQIDTVAPVAAITVGTDSVGDFFNEASFANGVTLNGTGEAGATIDVTISGVTQSTTVGSNGTWTATWPVGSLDAGEYTTGVTLVATDPYGNATTVTDTLVVDTVSDVTIETDSVETDGIVNNVERLDGVTLTGTSQAGSSVVVNFGTGSREVTVDAQGNWSADFAMSEIPVGELSAPVTAVATDSFGNSSTTTGDVDIDTLVRDFGFTGTAGGADGIVNIEEAAGGLEMTGTTEPGSTVNVSMNGFTHKATVAADGTWTVEFPAGQIPTGEQTVPMTAVATDIAGNVETITQDIVVDRDAGHLTIDDTPVEGDDVVNMVEASDGVVLTGTSYAGAVVTVTMAGVSHDVVTNSAGKWTANFAAGEVEPGDYLANIKATTVDSAGNALEATDSVHVDTRVDNLSIDVGAVGGGDGVINAIERLEGGGMVITGTTEVGSTSVVVTLQGEEVNATIDPATGNWSAVYSASQVAEGTYDAKATVSATDAAGNVDSVSGTIEIDTEVLPFAMTETGGGTDDVANAAEVSAGIDLGGQVEVGSTVIVTFDDVDHEASVDASGNWSLTVPPSAIRPGTYDAEIVVTATDPVGNVDTLSDMLAIDTEAPGGPVIASYTRDNAGIRGISTEISTDEVGIFEVNGNGSVTEVDTTQVDIPVIGETNFQFNSNVPDGSHLVITSTDDAGNVAGTYVVLDDESATSDISLSASALNGMNIETLDLNFAEEGNVTIDAQTLLDLSSNTNELKITGGSDDQVTITGAVQSGTTNVDGQDYNIFTLGDEGTLLINEDINVII